MIEWSEGNHCRLDLMYSLSLLANRMAKVCASGSPSLTSAAAFQTQLRSLPTFGESFMSGTTVAFVSIVDVLCRASAAVGSREDH